MTAARKHAFDVMMALSSEDRLRVQQALICTNTAEFRTLLRKNQPKILRLERQLREENDFIGPCRARPGTDEARMMRTALGNNTQTSYFSMPKNETGAVVIDCLGSSAYRFDVKASVLHFHGRLNTKSDRTLPTDSLYRDLEQGKELMLFEKRRYNQVEKVGWLRRDGDSFMDVHVYHSLQELQEMYPGKAHKSLLNAIGCKQYTYRMKMTIDPAANAHLCSEMHGQ